MEELDCSITSTLFETYSTLIIYQVSSIEILREAYKPKDLRVAPQDLYESEVFEYLSEYTLG